MSKKKKIAVISSQYFWLPKEAGPSRFYSIAEILRSHQFEVDVITSSFEHHLKKQRDQTQKSPFHMVYLSCPGYRKNISVAREISNIVFAVKVMKYLKRVGRKYDAVYCSMPPNNISAAVGKYCTKNHIPFIADIEDLWPEAMKMVFHCPVISDVLFYPYQRTAEKTYQYADGVIGTSNEYTKRALRFRKGDIVCKTVYVGCDVDEFDREANENLCQVSKKQNEFWITYAGTIGHSYAIDNMVKLAKILKNKKKTDMKIKILGTGPFKQKMENLAGKLGCDNIEFLGYVDHDKMASYLVKSDVLINSFAKGVPQSIVNKIGDYLAAAKPMINTLENHEFCSLVEKYRVGINVEAENPSKLYQAVNRLHKDPDMCRQMSANARRLAEEKFDRKQAYLEIVRLTDLCIRKKVSQKKGIGE